MPAASEDPGRDGRVVTFYSYKGGTGRSMALANVAWILAAAGKRVLVIDWDLEAPGLHRYFRPFLLDKDITGSDGLIDFVTDYCAETMKVLDASLEPEPIPPGRPFHEVEHFDAGRLPAEPAVSPAQRELPPGWYAEKADLFYYKSSLTYRFPGEGVLDFVPAGRQGASYPNRVNSFDWLLFYNRYGGGFLIDEMRARIKHDYDYVLVDSRTGVSDTSGICTIQIPDVLAVCFTLNNQSMEGAARIVDSVVRQRASKAPLSVFPIPMRIDSGAKDKVDLRLAAARRLFDRFVGHNGERLNAYWPAVGVPYVPDYSLEEQLSAFADSPDSPISLLPVWERLAAELTGDRVKKLEDNPTPELRQNVMKAFRAVDSEEAGANIPDDPVQRAEIALQGMTASQQEEAKRLLTRLVYLVDSGKDSVIEAPEGDLQPDPAVARLLAEAGIIKTGPVLTYTSDVYLTHWKRLQDWIEGERKVLLTRQQIRTLAKEWRESGRKPEYLLSGAKMQWAVMFFEQPSPVEKQFVEASQRRAKWRRIIPIAVAASAILGGLLGFNYYSQSNRASRILAAATAVNDPLVSVLLTRDLYSAPPPSSGLSALEQISKKRIPRVVLLGSKGPVYSACFSPDGQTVVSAGDDNTVRWWDSASGRQIRSATFAIDRDAAPFVDCASGEIAVKAGSRLGVFTSDGGSSTIDVHPSGIFAYRPDGEWLALGVGSFVEFISPLRWLPGFSQRVRVSGDVRSLAWSPDGHSLAVATSAGVTLWDADHGKVVYRLTDGAASKVTMNRDGTRVAALTRAEVAVWEAAGGKLLWRTTMNDIVSLAMGSGDLVAVGMRDGRINLLGSGPREITDVLHGHVNSVNDLRFSRDGHSLLSASDDGSVRIWPVYPSPYEAATWQSLIAALQGSTRACLFPVQRVRFLSESASAAESNYESCEKANGREPLHSDVLATVERQLGIDK